MAKELRDGPISPLVRRRSWLPRNKARRAIRQEATAALLATMRSLRIMRASKTQALAQPANDALQNAGSGRFLRSTDPTTWQTMQLLQDCLYSTIATFHIPALIGGGGRCARGNLGVGDVRGGRQRPLRWCSHRTDTWTALRSMQKSNRTPRRYRSWDLRKAAKLLATGVVGLVIWPVRFAMDFQNAAGKEVAALQSRQQYLATLAEQRCGALPPVSVQTVPPSAPATVATPLAAPTATSAPVPIAPASAPIAPASAPQMVDCGDADGSRVRVAGRRCPAPWKPAQ
jgi:hypothetical protein